MPDLYLVACLAGCWILLFLTLWKGVASSGKVKSNIIHTKFVVLKSSSSGCLFYSHFSIPCPDYITGERTHAWWSYWWNYFLYQTTVERITQSKSLVCSSYSVFFLPLNWIWSSHYILILQWLQAQLIPGCMDHQFYWHLHFPPGRLCDFLHTWKFGSWA